MDPASFRRGSLGSFWQTQSKHCLAGAVPPDKVFQVFPEPVSKRSTLYGLGYRYNIDPTMFWRAIFWVAVVEVLICVLPIELAGITALIRFFLFIS